MSERTVLRYGDPRLHQISAPLDDFHPGRMQALLDDLWDTMHARGGVGIAAPQIGRFVRVVVFGMSHSERYPEAPPIPRTVLINPVIESLSDDIEDNWEGCLSVPGMRGLVSRYQHIRYSGVDEGGEPFVREVDGFHARVVQHECDHLDGVLYPMRIKDLRDFGFEEELRRFERPQIIVAERIFTSSQACEMAFYAAFNAFDAGQMSEVWASNHAVWCVHPASPVLHGRDAVIASWKEIFSTPAPESMQLQISDHQVIETAELAVRFVHENIHHGPGLQMLSVVHATNVFVREGRGWKISSHHASPAPAQTAASRPQQQPGTMH